MFFLSNNILGADPNTIPLTPTNVNNITYVGIKNGLYDCLYITKEIETEPTFDCPKGWDHNTIFHADFNNSTNAGNVDWNLQSVSHTIIKRKDVSQFKWITLATKEIHKLEDFSMSGIDYMSAGNVQYEYALVPVLNGTEGLYNTVFVDSKFNGIFITEKNHIIGTAISDGFLNSARRISSASNITINSRFPTHIRNSKLNCEKGTFGGNFIESSENKCELYIEDNKRTKYQKSVIDFLSNGNPKILKHFDGRIYLINVIGEISNTADKVYNNRIISYEWEEAGDCLSEKDLYYANLSDVTEEWWDT